MDTKVDSQITIESHDPDVSAVDGNWVQHISGHILKISIVGTVPYNLMTTSKLAADLNAAVSGVICHHLIDIELVE